MRTWLSLALGSLLVVPLTAVPAVSASAPARGCAKGTFLFCEDFQSLPVGAAGSLRWGIDTKHGTLTVERAGRHGEKVLRVHTEGNGRAFLKVDDFAAPGNSFYGRVRLRVSAFPTAPDWAHYTLVEATGAGPEIVRPLGGQYAPPPHGGAQFWGVGADGGPTGDWTNWRTSAPSVAGTWQCVEWRMDATDNRVSLWFDGVPKPDLTVSTHDHGGNPVDFLFPRFDTVKLGWQLYQGDPTPASYDVWMDDIALSTKRVGC
ncbi:hypothetical protein Aph01nite_11240 [Acrocarpospora phusangensis]|uniref:Cip1-like core domain-containing protein n=1 Tax=Acrocarpospora phusangensis TaxID=1070424 RepID=A0A919Q5M4_9ACTN|nr:hypothetical protein [Acrocarpospora phusangensis]GIH22814.1 hypothetical protein Aph01nite_11240 [Acrocarpospora phusangensis]